MAKRKQFIIDDATPMDRVILPDKGRGLWDERPRGAYAYEGFAAPFPDELRVPESDWRDWIREKAERKTWLKDLMIENGIKIKNQKQTNYCWIFSPTLCNEIVRVKSGQPHVELSPASAGARIKNFRNVGGWGREALEFLANNGQCPSAEWGDTAIDRRLLTAERVESAKRFAIQEWYYFEPNDFAGMVSAVLRDMPFSVGLNWWSHQVTYVKLHWLDGRACPEAANSWDVTYGDDGYVTLQGNRAIPSDGCAPRTGLAA